MRLSFTIAILLCAACVCARIGNDLYTRTGKQMGRDLPVENNEDEEEEEDGENEEESAEDTDLHKKNHFMDQYFLQSGPVQYEFGHTCEDPDEWQQRYEKHDFDKHRHSGQIKWGDANGAQGEHYWDLNHGQDENEEVS